MQEETGYISREMKLQRKSKEMLAEKHCREQRTPVSGTSINTAERKSSVPDDGSTAFPD